MRLRSSEDKSVVLFESWLLLEHVLHQGVDLLACYFNLIVESLLLPSLFFKLDKLILLIKDCLDPTLLDHLCYKVLGLVGLDTQEVAKLAEPDVHVDSADDYNIVLDQRLVQD